MKTVRQILSVVARARDPLWEESWKTMHRINCTILSDQYTRQARNI